MPSVRMLTVIASAIFGFIFGFSVVAYEDILAQVPPIKFLMFLCHPILEVLTGDGNWRLGSLIAFAPIGIMSLLANVATCERMRSLEKEKASDSL